MKVFNTIKELLSFKGYCSYPEISKVSGLKSLEVIKILNLNKKLLKIHSKKPDRIVGLTNEVIVKELFYDTGKIYWIEKENYGTIEVINFIGNEKLRKELEESYICGGLGDNYTIKCIIHNRKNLDKIIGEGLREYKFTLLVEPVEKYWKE